MYAKNNNNCIFYLLCHICANNKYVSQMSCRQISSYSYIKQLCQYIFLIHMNSLQSTMWPGPLVYWTSHYWHMPRNKHVCHIAYIWPPHYYYCSHRPYVAAHISPKHNKMQQLFTKLVPCMCQQQIFPSNAKCMPHM